MEMNELVLAVIPEEAEAEAGTVTESRKRKRRIEGAEDNLEISTKDRTFITAKAQTVFEKELKERGFSVREDSVNSFPPSKKSSKKGDGRSW